MGWFTSLFVEPETREANYADTVVAALVASASGAGSHDVALTAAAEIARSQWGRAFAAARSDVLAPWALEMLGRALVSPGEIVFLRAGGELIPVAAHDIFGVGARPDDWKYRITINAPVGQLTREVGYHDVAHFRLRATPEAPWQGRSAWAACPTTASLAARLESSLANEERAGVGAVVAVPDAKKADEDGVTTALANAKGAILLGDSAAAQDGGTGRAASGREWSPVRFGPAPPDGQILLRSGVVGSILAAAGVPPALVAANTPASALREAYRQFLFGTIAPVGRVVGKEAQRVLGGAGLLDWSALSASDVTGRARAYASLIKAGMPDADARRVAGL